VLESKDSFEMITIPKFGRNEHAYVWHLARKAPSFASVEVFTKTGDIVKYRGWERPIDAGMVKYMVDVARDGSPYGTVSYPWGYDRRFLQVRCNEAWSNHSLTTSFASGVAIASKRWG